MWQTIQQWDRDLFVYLNSLGVEKYDRFWIVVTQTETWIPLYLLFAYLLFRFYSKKDALRVSFFLLLNLIVVLALMNITKHYVARLRPSNVEEWAELIRILQTPSNYSFFSGHSATSFAITTYMVLSLQKFSKWIYLSFLWPVLFALSRIYVGVHYPSDILVGTLVGIGMAFLFFMLCQKSMKKSIYNTR